MNAKTFGAAVLGAAALAACSSSSGGKKVLTGPQTGTATVTLATAATSFTQPKQIKLSGTAVYDDVADTVTLSLTIKNGSKTVLHNPKVLVTGLSEGAVVGDGTFGPSPAEGGGSPDYIYYGPESIPPGGTTSRDIDFTGVLGAGADLTMDIEILVHPWIFVPANDDAVVATDASGTGQELYLFDLDEIEDLGFGGDGAGGTSLTPDSWQRADTMSPDTRYVYYTNRNQPAIITFDTVDHTMTIGPSLMGGTIQHDGLGVVGCIDGMTASPDGKLLYATLNQDAHVSSFDEIWPTPTLIEVLKIDAKSLAVKDRVTVWEPPAPSPGAGEGGPPYYPEIRGRAISVTPDGKFGAVSITGASEVSMLNLGNMTVMDTWTTTGFVPRHAAISPDASTIAVCYTWRDDSDGTLELIDVATGTLSDLVPDTLDAGTSTYSPFLQYGPDGRLYYGRAYNSLVPGVSIYDPVAMTWSEPIAPGFGYGNAIAFTSDTWCIYDEDSNSVRCFDYTDVEQTFPATGATGISTSGSWGHGIVITE